MRLGLSTLLVVALASASLVACGDSDTGSGGAGGTGGGATSGGGDDTGSGGETGTGGDPGTGGAGGGDPLTCTPDVVASADECDAGCDHTVTNNDTGAVMCTIQCVEDIDCGEDTQVICAEDEASGGTACLYDCSVDGCPGSEYVCDQVSLLCLPDEPGA